MRTRSIIENYTEMREELQNRNYKMRLIYLVYMYKIDFGKVMSEMNSLQVRDCDLFLYC